MADIPMKSIQWPGLPDTYTFLQKASTLTDSDAGKAADAYVVGEALGQLQAGYVAADEVLGQRIDQLEAEIDTDSGEAPTLVAGTAEQLLSTTGTVNPTPYTYRANTSGSDRVTVRQITGGTVAFNQLASMTPGSATSKGITRTVNADGTVSFSGTADSAYTCNIQSSSRTGVAGHVILLRGCPSGGSTEGYRLQDGSNTTASRDFGDGRIYAVTHSEGKTVAQIAISNGATVTNVVFTPQYFDLTQMFGATVAQYFLDLETATAGAGIALFRQMFPESYYPYNAGELVSVQTSGRKTVGFNQWDEVWEAGAISQNTGADVNNSYAIRSKNYVSCVPNTKYYIKKPNGFSAGNFAITWYDENKVQIGRLGDNSSSGYTATSPSGAYYFRIYCGNSSNPMTTYRHDICINIFDPSRNGTYEPYSDHTYPLDSTLTLRGIPVLSGGVPAYDGDKYAPDGTVTRRYMFIPDLGALSWIYSPTNGIFYTTNSALMGVHATYQVLASGAYNQSKSKYGSNFASAQDKTICLVSGQTQLAIKDTSYSDSTAFKAAVSGISAVVALATPTTETAAPYQSIQIAGSTEEFLPPETDTRPAAVPVGSVSLYQTNLREGLETLLNTDLAHAESIAPVQGSTASTNISSGELLMKDGKLYKATQAIVAGAEIGSTNTTETTLAAQLAALEARIAALEN